MSKIANVVTLIVSVIIIYAGAGFKVLVLLAVGICLFVMVIIEEFERIIMNAVKLIKEQKDDAP